MNECPHDKVYFFEEYRDEFAEVNFVIATCRACKCRVRLNDHVAAAVLNRMAVGGNNGVVP